jgi:phage gp29-like protein
MRDLIVDCSVDDGQMKDDGLVKSPIYVVVGLARQFAVPYVLPNCRARHYASYIELFPEPIRMAKLTFYEIIKDSE